MTRMNDAVWDYLRLESGQTLGKIWGNLERLRRLGMKYHDLPATHEEFLSCLNALLAQGRAAKVGELWMVTFASAKIADKPKMQPALF